MSTSTKSTSVLTGGANSKLTTAAEINAPVTDFFTAGVVGAIANTNGSAPATGGFAVNAHGSPDMGIAISSGQIYITTTPTGQSSQLLRTNSASTEDVTIANNTSGATKFDWIYAANSATNANTPDTPGITITSFVVSRSSNASTDDGGNTPTYGKLLAIVQVINNAVSITNGNITDKRVQSSVTAPALTTSSTSGWNAIAASLTYSANNGNKEFVVNSGIDLTGSLSAGMKIKFDRSTAPGTQAMAFASASTQYATKTTPTGLTFNAAFTCESWIFPNSYGAVNASTVVSQRVSATGSWGLRLEQVSGVATIYYGDAVPNFTVLSSVQSIPIKRWTHLAGVITSVSAKTGAMYINGLLVPSVFSSASATSLVHAGPLTVGAYNTGSEPWDGYLSEVRVWSVAQTATAIQNNMGINAVGSEANLVVLIRGNGNFNDATSNANNLTATNGAIATQLANPFNSTELGIITKISSTQITISTGETCSIPNMALNNPFFSAMQTPYGLPNDLSSTVGRRLAYIPINSAPTTTSTTPTNPFPAVQSYPFTVPQNCNKIFICTASAAVGSAGTEVFGIYNGSITPTNQIGQLNAPINGGQFTARIPVNVIPGSQILLSVAWYTTSGTASFSPGYNLGPNGGNDAAFWAETA